LQETSLQEVKGNSGNNVGKQYRSHVWPWLRKWYDLATVKENKQVPNIKSIRDFPGPDEWPT
jgi:hypothetical protein